MRIFHIRPFIAFILILFLLTGCSTSSGQKEEPPVYSPLQVLVPEAPGKKTLGASPLTLDISNAGSRIPHRNFWFWQSEDECPAHQRKWSGLFIFCQSREKRSHSFFQWKRHLSDMLLSTDWRLPICSIICRYSGSQLRKEFLPFLYPNQYVNFTPDSASSKLALSIISEDASDVDALQAVYNYVVQNLTYDYDLADTVDSGYIPDVDSTLKSGKGICFDYAALTTAMLRARDIPCKLQIGYAGTVKHAGSAFISVKRLGWQSCRIQWQILVTYGSHFWFQQQG